VIPEFKPRFSDDKYETLLDHISYLNEELRKKHLEMMLLKEELRRCRDGD
jgi:hypothetical protein